MKRYLIAYCVPHPDLGGVVTSIHLGENMKEAIQDFKDHGRVFHQYKIVAITELDSEVDPTDLFCDRVHSKSYIEKHGGSK